MSPSTKLRKLGRCASAFKRIIKSSLRLGARRELTQGTETVLLLLPITSPRLFLCFFQQIPRGAWRGAICQALRVVTIHFTEAGEEAEEGDADSEEDAEAEEAEEADSLVTRETCATESIYLT